MTTDSVGDFYDGLSKPDLAPPKAVFGPVWTVLYVLLGIVLYRLWQKRSEYQFVRIALGTFIFQLVLNALWTPIFFSTKDAGLALLVIAIMDLLVLGLMGLMWNRDKISVVLLLPYLAWIGFATWLNYKILMLNSVDGASVEKFTFLF